MATPGRYVSEDGLRVVRLGNNDILGMHGGGKHINFEIFKPNPSKVGKMMRIKNMHVYLTD